MLKMTRFSTAKFLILFLQITLYGKANLGEWKFKHPPKDLNYFFVNATKTPQFGDLIQRFREIFAYISRTTCMTFTEIPEPLESSYNNTIKIDLWKGRLRASAGVNDDNNSWSNIDIISFSKM